VRKRTDTGSRSAPVYPFDTVVRWPGLVARFVVGWARPFDGPAAMGYSARIEVRCRS
jgi:hypothetical protein